MSTMFHKRKSEEANFEYGKRRPFNDDEIVPLPNAILTVGDKCEKRSISEDIENLLTVLKKDLLTRKNIITDEICECIYKMQNKISIYVTVVGMLNSYNNDFGADFIESLSVLFQDFLNEQKFDSAYNILLAFSELVNVYVVSPISFLSLLENFVAFLVEDNISCLYKDWILSSVLRVLPWSGETLEQSKSSKGGFSQLLSTISAILGKRQKEYVKALRLLANPDILVQEENIDLLWMVLISLRKNNWKNDAIYKPYEHFKHEISSSQTHKISTIKLSLNVQLKYLPTPSLSFFLFNQNDCQHFVCGKYLPRHDSLERYYYSSEILRIINSNDNRKQCVRELDKIISHQKYCTPYIIVDAIFSQILKPAPYDGSSVHYYGILLELSNCYENVFPDIIKQSVTIIRENMQHMNVAALQRFTDWFSFHLNGLMFVWNWSEFEFDYDLPSDNPKKIFLLELFERLIRLADVTKFPQLLDGYLKLYGKERVSVCKYQQIDRSKENNLFHDLVKILSSKQPPNETLDQLNTQILHVQDQIETGEITKIVVTVLLKGGQKTPFHTQSIFTKYFDFIKMVVNSDEARLHCIQAIFDFWQYDTFRLILVIDLLLRLEVLTYTSVILWLFESEVVVRSSGFILWEIIHRCLTIITCGIEKQRKLYHNVKENIALKNNKSETEDDAAKMVKTMDEETIETMRLKLKEKKEEKRGLLILILKKIVDSIMLHVQKSKEEGTKLVNRWFVWTLQRLQQILFENCKLLSNSQDVLQSIISNSHMEEHVVEIIKRFQSFQV